MQITIPNFTITSLNKITYKHWRKVKKIKDETKELVGWYLKGIDPIEPPVEIEIVSYFNDKIRRDILVVMDNNKEEKYHKPCKFCGEDFYVEYKSRLNRRKYCSTDCAYEDRYNGKKVSCDNCEKKFYRPKGELKENNYCSRECYNTNRVGEKKETWTEKEIENFKKLYPIEGKKFCMDFFDKTEGQVRSLAHRHNIKVDKTTDKFKERTTGHTPWSKGKKRPKQAGVMRKNIEEGKHFFQMYPEKLETMGKFKHTHNGWRNIAGEDIYFRSRWEANYARYLQWLKENGEIKDWEYEPKTFWFEEIKRGTRSYKPDFRVVEKDGTVEWHEVKGYMDSKSKTKIKRLKKYHDIEVKLIRKDFIKELNSNYSKLIQDWE